MIKPLRDYVVLKPEEKEQKIGSIYIATKKEDQEGVAVVVNVGPGYIDEKGNKVGVDVKVGDKVLFKKYSANEYVDENKERYNVVRNSDIIAIIE